MSIEGKHAYRFGYLKSEQWKNVRLQALVREKACCQICGEESISNDAHHIWYPENIYETTEAHLVILCRGCHDFIHAMIPDCKTSDEEEGRAHWNKFTNAIILWRRHKNYIFLEDDEKGPVKAHELRMAYQAMKQRNREYLALILKLNPAFKVDEFVPESRLLKTESFEKALDRILTQIRTWALAFRDSKK